MMKKLFLIDANSIIYRCFYALPELTTPVGEAIQAIYGLASVLLKIIKEDPPDYAAAAFDRKEKTFRAEAFEQYKAQRPPVPPELVSQIEKSYELFKMFNIPTFDLAGFEADDIIGTLAEKFKKEEGLEVIILSGDLDNLQLVDKNVFVRTFLKGISETVLYDEKKVVERYGLQPEQLSDYKGLVGDPSDNIPGVPGIGPKTALPIIKTYGTLANFYKKIENVKIPETPKSREEKIYKKLLTFKEHAIRSRDLALIRRDVPLEVQSLDELRWTKPDAAKLREYFNSLGFKTLAGRVGDGTIGNGGSSRAPENTIFLEDADAALERGKAILEDEGILKVSFGIKDILKAMRAKNISLKPPYFDLGIAYWLIDPDAKKYDHVSLAKRFLRKEAGREDWIALFNFARRKLKEYELEHLFTSLEMPFIEVLADMEMRGIKVDVVYLKNLSREAGTAIRHFEDEVWRMAGVKFNLNSPQQVAEVLFKKLGISAKGVKKTRKGKISTSFENLELIKDTNPVIPAILKYREVFKLKSTYIDPLLRLAGDDGRVRTTYLQTGTATGRLSSQEPNLQNIPAGSDWADKLRHAFVSEEGFSLISFDYSQIELRILASVSGDKKMMEIFRRGEDIHTSTAANIFNVSPDKVSPSMRRIAKTLNFGIIYGMGAVSFSAASGLNREKAQHFIEEYFKDFPEVKRWQEQVKEEAKTFGFVKNLNGRRRWLFNIVSGNRGMAAESERAAINMPIQSLDADIMKMAMLRIHEAVKKRKLPAEKVRMILTIHDELLFEIGDDMIEKAIPVIRDIMESAYTLAVPLKVDVVSGKMWSALKK